MTRLSSSSKYRLFAVIFFFSIAQMSLVAQLPTAASPAQWLFPRGNKEGTQSQFIKSLPQALDSLILKWSSNAIAGDVQPLVGNIINNAPLIPTNPYAPLEITAVIAGQLVTIDATGRTVSVTRLPPFVRAVSVIMDSSSLPLEVYKQYPSILGLETIERRDTTDSLAYAYIAAHDTLRDSITVLKNLAVDVRPYAPNLFASVKPIFGRPIGNQVAIHSIVNMSSPQLPLTPNSTPFFRGITSFMSGSFASGQIPIVSDTMSARFTVGPSVSFGQASISELSVGRFDCVLPCLPTSIDWNIPDSFRPSLTTYANRPYLFGVEFLGPTSSEGIVPLDLLPLTQQGQSSTRPRIENFYVNLQDAGSGSASNPYVLVAEEYLGRDSSDGFSRLHLYNTIGDPVTSPLDTANPSFMAKRNHSWAVGVGDVDGLDTNELLPYYPHNPGSEIIVSQSTHEFAYAASKIMVLRYRSGKRIQKTTPRNAYLFPFDTVVTAPMTGWIACVSDLDNNGDAKSEIFIADGSEMYVLRMRDYRDSRFIQSDPFDTVFTYSFPTENINHIAVADVDGDSYNDILVTTNVRTYLFGLAANRSVFILSPSRTTSSTVSICMGDSARISWYNVFRGQPAVSLKFQEYRNGRAIDTARVIARTVANDADTVRYVFIADSTLSGKTGRFIVESTARPSIRDSSAFVSFVAPFIRFDSLTKVSRYQAHQFAEVQGTLHCLDSIQLFSSIDSGKTWTSMQSKFQLPSDTSFVCRVLFPCPNFYGCQVDSDSLIRLRVQGTSRSRALVYSDTIAAVIKPDELPTRVYPEPSILCTERGFLWLTPRDSTVCDTVSLLVSYDLGKTFQLLENFPRSENEYSYHPIIGSPDTVVIRICCVGTCLRTDTVLVNSRAKLIHKVAPNPFEPGVDVCEIFTSAPINTTANIRIFDQNDHIVTEIAKNDSRLAHRVYCDRWDGKTDNGTVVGMGMYYIVVEYGDGTREFYPVFVKKK